VRTFAEIAQEIQRLWVDKSGKPNVWFGAVPYIEAMLTLDTSDPDAPYFAEDAKSIVIYGLSNMAQFRGEDAKRIKAELKGMVGIK